MRRSFVPSALAVKTVSSPNFPLARVKRILPRNAVLAIAGDAKEDANPAAPATEPGADEDACPAVADEIVISAAARTRSASSRLPPPV
jgi:hypothetical protein